MSRPAPAAVPDRVTVGAHIWRIVADDDAHDRCIEDGDRGHAIPDRQLIELDARRPPSGVAETLLHELLHALLDDAGATVHPKLSEEVLEAVITLAAPRLLHTLRADPAVVDYLVNAR